ncbi:uncharacterized protein LOC132394584 isoform X2 [Hypanus sabinus]|uniref:uncharacterized protein LOC132394584 isoform X2 n=1 Tax=Hypanus sabinus TaxID=79690 RepID=UPI0028C44A9D|nr:uncharacterized protein LOC132394584 isoform X2 [Hypanus sabinus]
MTFYRWATAIVFLLISEILPGTEAKNGPVFQTPATIHLFEGDTLMLNCTFKLSGVASYTWHKDDCLMDLKSQRYEGRTVLPVKSTFLTKKDASIWIKNVTVFDSGRYYCKIAELGKSEEKGDGTLVTVNKNCKTAMHSRAIHLDWQWIGIAGIIIDFAILLFTAYALLVRECTSFDSAKEPIAPPRRKMNDHANHQHEDAYLHCHNKEGAPKRKRPPPARRNMQ